MWKRLLPVYSQNARHCRLLFDTGPIAFTNRTICYSHPLLVKRDILHKEIISKYEHEKANLAAAEAREAEKEAFSREKIREILEEQEEQQKPYSIIQETDMPVPNMKNPFEKPARKCVLCECNVPIDYKNVRLLSQFVSLHTGRIYGRHITGLCLYMQRRVGKLINRSRYFGYMPYVYKNPQFLRDPKLFDPYRKGP